MINTATVAPRERLDFWADTVERIFFPVSFRPSRREPFGGRISLYRLGRVTMTRVASEPTVLTRTASSIAKYDPEALHLLTVLRGRSIVRQDDRVAEVTAGKMVLYDTSRPFSITTDEPFELVTIETPRALLGPRAHRDFLETARPVSSDLVRSLVLPFLFRFADRLSEDDAPEDEVDLGESVLDLVRALYTDRTPRPAGRLGAGRLPEIKDYIEQHLGDDLRPDTIARAHYISTRSLQKLFQAEGLTVSDWTRDRRLIRCHRDLLDPALADEKIATIALRSGMPNAAHFSRAFRAAYGVAPSELRALATAEPVTDETLGGRPRS